jgi:hypothetical protein
MWICRVSFVFVFNSSSDSTKASFAFSCWKADYSPLLVGLGVLLLQLTVVVDE